VTTVKIKVNTSKKLFYTVIFRASCFGWANVDVCDSNHVIRIHYLIRQSRDNCENNDRETKNHNLSRILQENCSELWFLKLHVQTGQSLSVLTFVAVVTGY